MQNKTLPHYPITAIVLGKNGLTYSAERLDATAKSKTGAVRALRRLGYVVCKEGGLAEFGHDDTWHITVWCKK